MVSTHLKTISQIGSFLQVGVNIKKNLKPRNHHLVNFILRFSPDKSPRKLSKGSQGPVYKVGPSDKWGWNFTPVKTPLFRPFVGAIITFPQTNSNSPMKIHGCLEYFLVSFWVSAYLQMLLTLTPRKINMEHNHGGLVPIIFPCKWVICSFQPFIFHGVVFSDPSLQVPETGRSVALHIKPKLKPQAPCVLCWKTRG